MRLGIPRCCALLATSVLTAAAGAVPANDLCTGAEVIDHYADEMILPPTFPGDLDGGGVESAWSCAVQAVPIDIWYSFTPNRTGRLKIDTYYQGGTKTTALSVHTSCAAGSEIACDAHGGVNESSDIVLPVTGGVTYLIRVGAYAATLPALRLRFSDSFNIANDTCGTAQAITAGTQVNFDTTFAIAENDPNIDGLSRHDRWYVFTAPAAGRLQASTNNVRIRSMMYRGCGGTSELIATPNGTVSLQTGEQVHIRVQHAPGWYTGPVTLELTFTQGVEHMPTPSGAVSESETCASRLAPILSVDDVVNDGPTGFLPQSYTIWSDPFVCGQITKGTLPFVNGTPQLSALDPTSGLRSPQQPSPGTFYPGTVFSDTDTYTFTPTGQAPMLFLGSAQSPISLRMWQYSDGETAYILRQTTTPTFRFVDTLSPFWSDWGAYPRALAVTRVDESTHFGLPGCTPASDYWFVGYKLDGSVTISSQPGNRYSSAGATATFTVASNIASNGSNYIWWKNGQILLTNGGRFSGCNSPTLTIINVNASDLGTYSVTITNGCSAALSKEANLTFDLPLGSCAVGFNCTPNLLQSQCASIGGTWTIEGVCPPTGACVVGSSCFIRSQAHCNTTNGTYFGDNVTCIVTGACCTNNVCAVKSIENCVTGGGTFVGLDTAEWCPMNTNIQILPDPTASTGVESTLAVIDPETITSTTVTIDLVHPRGSDLALQLFLRNPEGSSVTLLNRVPVSGTSCPNATTIGADFKFDGVYTFDDTASMTIRQAALATPPGGIVPPGRYRPDSTCGSGTPQTLGLRLGERPQNGIWAMRAIDRVAGQTGTIRSWSVAVNGVPVELFSCEPSCPADFNGDDTRDVADLFAYINAWLAKTSNADFNASGNVDVADLFAYINAWLAGC